MPRLKLEGGADRSPVETALPPFSPCPPTPSFPFAGYCFFAEIKMLRGEFPGNQR